MTQTYKHVTSVEQAIEIIGQRRGAGKRLGPHHCFGRNQMDERLVGGGHFRGRVLQRHVELRRQGRDAVSVVAATSGFGTFETWRHVHLESVLRSKADVIISKQPARRCMILEQFYARQSSSQRCLA